MKDLSNYVDIFGSLTHRFVRPWKWKIYSDPLAVTYQVLFYNFVHLFSEITVDILIRKTVKNKIDI